MSGEIFEAPMTASISCCLCFFLCLLVFARSGFVLPSCLLAFAFGPARGCLRFCFCFACVCFSFRLVLLVFAFVVSCFCLCSRLLSLVIACVLFLFVLFSFLFSSALRYSPSLSFPLLCSPLLSRDQKGGHSSAQLR